MSEKKQLITTLSNMSPHFLKLQAHLFFLLTYKPFIPSLNLLRAKHFFGKLLILSFAFILFHDSKSNFKTTYAKYIFLTQKGLVLK